MKYPAQLATTPGLIRTLLEQVTEEQAAQKPNPERFSIAEVVSHLAHCERHAYLPKYHAFTSGQREVAAYDVDRYKAEGAFSGRSVTDALADFDRARDESLLVLDALPENAGDRTAIHSKMGEIRLSDLLNECAFHDIGHLRQIAELIRAWLYHPNMGPYRAEYRINP